MKSKNKKNTLVVFVEGATEKVFLQKLKAYFLAKKENKNANYFEVINLNGVGNYKSKAIAKFKNAIKPKYQNSKFHIFFMYDTDVFAFKKKPPLNWKKIEQDFSKNGISKVHHIKVEKMIEDWFLLDLKGLCSFLKLKKTPILKGKDGHEKMKYLFKKANKIYLKGNYCQHFLDNLDVSLIYSKNKKQLEKLEMCLFA